MIPLPLLLGAAGLFFVAGKKKKRSNNVRVSVIPARTQDGQPIPGWDDIAAREKMEDRWEEMGKVANSGGAHFVLMRDTAMELWPSIKWPLTINDELRMVNVSPGSQIPTWVYNLGPQGDAVLKIWIKLRTLAWDITDYKPPN